MNVSTQSGYLTTYSISTMTSFNFIFRNWSRSSSVLLWGIDLSKMSVTKEFGHGS